MESKQLKGHGYVRKSKAAGLVCGIVLGAALFAGANSASADEVSSAPTLAPATAAETPAPKAQGQAQDSTVTVDEGLTDAANKAKAAGLTVEQEATKDLGTATTEDQAKQFDDTAKKEVAAQKAEIEKKTSDYAAAVTTAEKARKELVDNLVKNPLLYYSASSQLNDAADVDFNNGKASFGDFSSSKGSVDFLNTPNSVELNLSGMKSVVGSASGQMKEITTYYAQGNMFSGNTSVADKKNAKGVPISISQGETITYKVNYAADSELGKLGVAYVEKKITLVKSPVKNGKTVLLADRYGSVSGNFVIGGTGNANNDVLNIGDWSYEFSKTYYGKDGKILNSKELTANVFNKYAFGGKDVMKASDIQLAVSPQNRDWTVHNGSDADLSQKKSLTGVYGGEAFLKSTLVETVTQRDSSAINPHGHEMFFHSQKLQQADVSRIGVPDKPTVKYHLVSYKKAVKSTLPGDNATGSVTVEHVTDKGEVLQATKDVVKNGKVGSDYTTEAGKFDTKETVNEGDKVIERSTTYKLVETPANAKGKVVEGTTHVKYVYTKSVTDKDVTPKPTPLPVNDPTTIHIDRDGKEIAPKEKGTKGFKKIPGYEADPTSLLNKEDPKGQSVRVYRKVEPKVDPKENPVTIHIDTEGKTVAPKEDGTKGFKEIPGYEKYPEDPKNVENVNGITVRVYKKLEDKPVQPTTPVEPAQPSPAAPATQKLNTLPETGTATSILSVVGAALGGLGVVGLKSKKDEE